MFAFFVKALNCFTILLFFSSHHSRVSYAKNVADSCSKEPDDVVSKTVVADVVLIGSVSKIFSSSLFESCAEFRKAEFLKGALENEPLVVCRSNLKCDETLLEEMEKYIIFLNSTESWDKEIQDVFYHMASSPLPYSVKTSDNILGFISDPSIGQSPEIRVPEKTLINESLGDRTNLTCFFTGFPIPTIHWKKDGISLQSSEDIKIKTNKSQSILELKELQVDHTGNYECFAQNVFGSDSIIFIVRSYKMHAFPCSSNSFCFDRGNCYISEERKLCECKSGFGGSRCQLAEGESKEIIIGSGETSKSIQTLLLIITVAVVVTGVVILLYATIRGFYVGANYKKIQPNISSQLLQPEDPRNGASQSMETNGNIVKTVLPTEATQVRSICSPASYRPRLDGTSTPTFSEETVWDSRGSRDVHINMEDDQTTPSLLTFAKAERNQFQTSSTISATFQEITSESVPIKVSII